MNINSVDILTEDVWRQFSNRKKRGRIDFVYDTDTDLFYAVPKDVEHKDFTRFINGRPEALIPVQFRVDYQEDKRVIKEILVGVSSYEADYSVRHSQASLAKAFNDTFTWLASQPCLELNPTRSKIYHLFVKR